MAEGGEGAIPVTAAQRRAVEACLHERTLTPRLRERLEMVQGASLGQDLAAIARWSGRSERRVRYWLGRFLEGGLTALNDVPRPGRPPQADGAYLAALETALEPPPLALALPFDVWTSARLSAYRAETTGVRLTPGWLRARLARRRFACGRPKHTRKHLQDPAEVAACDATLAAVGEKGGG